MNPGIKNVFPLISTFLILTAASVVSKFVLAGKGGIDYSVLIAASCLFFLVSLLVFRMQYRAMQHSNPNVFVRSVMSGMIIKVVVCIGAVVAYYFLAGKAFNKPAVYLAMIIYIIFLTVEVRTIMKLNKSKNA
ncbi:MAG TPA: hypothetical protein PLZ45_10715 [Ferruginibacter sp.]|nr:hypothetical protein [Chitinophagaceae bacterium]HRI25141.1 hypothetical protein [Ferruginibacter sp.]